MNKEECLQYLNAKKIDYELYEHAAVFTMEQMHQQHIPGEERVAKNLFLKDDKKRHYYLITVSGDQTVDLKQLQEDLPSRRLSFASEEDLRQILGLIRGSVTPLGILNDTGHKVQLRVDDRFRGSRIGMHPLVNTATVFLDADDLMELLKDSGADVGWIHL